MCKYFIINIFIGKFKLLINKILYEVIQSKLLSLGNKFLLHHLFLINKSNS